MRVGEKLLSVKPAFVIKINSSRRGFSSVEIQHKCRVTNCSVYLFIYAKSLSSHFCTKLRAFREDFDGNAWQKALVAIRNQS
jgi:hypothetical protein